MILTVFLMFAAGPLDEIDAARAAAFRLPEDRRAYTIYVSFLGSEDIDETRLNAEIAINHVTRRIKNQRIRKVLGSLRETLYYLDYEELGWNADGVKRMLSREPYFYPIAPEVYMVRGDWLLREITFGKTYYDLLFDNPKNLNDIFKRLGFDDKSEAVKVVQNGSRVVESRVAVSGYRVATCLGNSPSGPVFITDDINAPKVGDKPKEFIREKVDALRFKNPDAHEAFGQLPNGFYWYALANAKGDLQDAAPDKIAVDNRDYRDPALLKDIVNERPDRNLTTIENPHTCMTCHALGTQPAPDWVADAMAGNKLTVTGYDVKTRDKIEDFYSQPRQTSIMDSSSRTYTSAVSKLAMVPAQKAMRDFAVTRWKWDRSPVTRKQAAAELNVDEKEFERLAGLAEATSTDQPGFQLRIGIAYWLVEKGRKDAAKAVLGYDEEEFKKFLTGNLQLPLGTNSLNVLGRGGSISRAEWEGQVATEASLIFCYEKRAQQNVTADMLRKKLANAEPPLPSKTAAPPPDKSNLPPPIQKQNPLNAGQIAPETYRDAPVGSRLPFFDPRTRETYIVEKAADLQWYKVN